jgi:hypothetical protein
MAIKKIRGDFGGGRDPLQPQQPRAPIEEDDTLESKSIARVLSLISEGEIAGFGRDDVVVTQVYNVSTTTPTATITLPSERVGKENVSAVVTDVVITGPGSVNVSVGQSVSNGFVIIFT